MDLIEVIGEMTDDEDFGELIVQIIRAPRTFRPRVDHFLKWSDSEFRDRFRLSKPVARYVLDRISPQIMSHSFRNHALSPDQMLFATLRYLATGSMLYVIGDLNGVDKSTVSRLLTKVINVLARLKNTFLEMPQTEEEIKAVQQGFYNIARFPRCVGALDCTHIKISSPGGEQAEIFRNRKGFFSYNVQGVCDADLIIRNLVCRWHGSAHDSMIFRHSRLRVNMENNVYGTESLLVGDSGYPLTRYLITPLANPRTRAEQLYNESQIRTRNPIERCFGVWKRRFPVLALGIRVKIEKVEAIVIATAVLHNIATHMNDEVPTVNEEEANAIDLTMHVNEYVARRRNPHPNDNSIVRNVLINEYFQGLVNN